MSTRLYWADGPWSGKLALAARPRGGDWLEMKLPPGERLGSTQSFRCSLPKRNKNSILRTKRARSKKTNEVPVLANS